MRITTTARGAAVMTSIVSDNSPYVVIRPHSRTLFPRSVTETTQQRAKTGRNPMTVG